jgi:hypothetical protein
MPAYLTDPRNQIIEIQRNLRDRYRTRLSILKELIQNADDAGARTLHLNLCNGQQGAANPLIRVPDLLVVNDGRFTRDNERGIRWLSATSKAEEAGSAGLSLLKNLFGLRIGWQVKIRVMIFLQLKRTSPQV